MNFISSIVVVSNQSLSVDFIRVYVFKQQVTHRNYIKRFPTISHCREQPIKNGTKKLSNLNEVDEMVIFIVGADGGEELFEWSFVSVGQCPVTHIKS